MAVVVTRPRWWRYRQQEAAAADWEGRVKADVAAPPPEARVQAGGGPAVPVTALTVALTEAYPAQRDTVLDALRASSAEAAAGEMAAADAERPPCRHWYVPSTGLGGACAECHGAATGPIHVGEDPHWDAPHRFHEEPGRPTRCLCGRGAIDTLHGDSLEVTAPPPSATEAAADEAAGTVPLPPIPKPEPLPPGILGYNVASRRTLGAAPGWLMTADLMSMEHAVHMLKVTGGVLVEVRAVER